MDEKRIEYGSNARRTPTIILIFDDGSDLVHDVHTQQRDDTANKYLRKQDHPIAFKKIENSGDE